MTERRPSPELFAKIEKLLDAIEEVVADEFVGPNTKKMLVLDAAKNPDRINDGLEEFLCWFEPDEDY